jgi:hypothetical protein
MGRIGLRVLPVLVAIPGDLGARFCLHLAKPLDHKHPEGTSSGSFEDNNFFRVGAGEAVSSETRDGLVSSLSIGVLATITFRTSSIMCRSWC